jgi:hypothetical protein
MSQTLPDKELAELRRRFKKGYTLEHQPNGHYYVLDPQGDKVLKPGKSTPLSLAGTPKTGMAKATIADLERAGVLRTVTRKEEPTAPSMRMQHAAPPSTR